MKFRSYLSENIHLPWKQAYIQYDQLNGLLKRPLWTAEDEIEFISSIDAQIESVGQFINEKAKESRGFVETHLLADFIHLNNLGFQKILKKHDKLTKFDLLSQFKDWSQIELLTKYYEATYWVHPDLIKELEAILLFYLPRAPTRQVDSTYYDHDDFRHYMDVLGKKGDVLRTTRQDGTALFERKTYQDKQVTHHITSVPTQLAYKDINLSIDQLRYTKPLLSCNYQCAFYSANPQSLFTLKTEICLSQKPEGKNKSFSYGILVAQTSDQIPEWLAEFVNRNQLIAEIPYFHEYLHGVMLFFQPPLKPWWSHEKILIDSKPTKKKQRNMLFWFSRLKTAIQHPYGYTKNIPVYESDEEIDLLKWLFAKMRGRTLPIHHNAKVEPKLFLANERILMSWLTFCALLLALALSLINFGDQTSRQSGTLFIIIAIGVTCYALLRFQYRTWQIRFRCQYRYDDTYGPAGLCFIFVLALLINFGLRMNHSPPKDLYLEKN